MSIETELKLRITPESLARLKRHALLRKYSVSRPVTRRLYNIYFDTPKLALHNARMALRLRRVGRQWIQTLKGGGSVRAGLHQRNEWEVPVSRPELDFSMSLGMSGGGVIDWDTLLPQAVRKKLHPVFVTDFTRMVRMLDYHGAIIELCMDHGQVSTEQHGMPLCELELELKSGEPQLIFELALEILEVVPVELEVVNKAQYGYRLLSGFVETPVKSVPPEIDKTATLPDVLQAQIWSCLLHLQNNLRGAMTSDDTEYLHQMRVALRRLRVALRMTEKFCADEALAILNTEVATLCVALGRIREWDVFIEQTLQPMCKRMAGHTGLQALLARCETARASCYATFRSEDQARELQRLILRFSIWMNGGYWPQLEEGAPGTREFATRHLQKLSRRFWRAGKKLSTVDAQQLHMLRILAKKLRYSAEFFADFYDGKKTRRFLSVLSKMQDVLGQINDVAVAHRLLDDLSGDVQLATHQEAIALAKGWIAHDLSHQFEALHDSARRFSKLSSFWEG